MGLFFLGGKDKDKNNKCKNNKRVTTTAATVARGQQ
jgi:hypothetical protein